MVLKRLAEIGQLLLIGVWASHAAAQGEFRAADAELKQGIVLHAGDSSRIVQQIATVTDATGASLSWSGFLQTPYGGTYQLGIKVRGNVRVTLQGDTVLEGEAEQLTWLASDALSLDAGRHPLQIALVPFSADGGVELTAFWSGPNFRFEPIPETRLAHLHDAAAKTFPKRGRDLVRALRCQACHDVRGMPDELLRAPRLTEAATWLRPSWIQNYLSRDGQPVDDATAPHDWTSFHRQFNSQETKDVVAFLASLTRPTAEDQPRPAGKPTGGQTLLVSKGCLACHQLDGLGQHGLFGGGDLSSLSTKRPPEFVRRWLENPGALNPDHRMPQFELSQDELEALAAFLNRSPAAAEQPPAASAEAAARGQRLVAKHRCVACHQVGELADEKQLTRLDELSDWSVSCLNAGRKVNGQPTFQLASGDDEQAIEQFVRWTSPLDSQQQTTLLLQENNCFQCHARHSLPGIQPLSQAVVRRYGDLLNELPRMKPPSLNSVGDKLTRASLRRVITRESGARRPWLHVQMPRFPLTDRQTSAIVDYFVAADRIPDEAIPDPPELSPGDLQGLDRLVTSDGFGCTSCHAVGKVRPPASTPINQLGPGLSMMGDRIRRTWFERWVRNPARIIPKMEMPSVQVAVPGLLEGDLDRQLSAVWQLLNTKRFSPPDPQPTRVVFHSGAATEPAIVLTDVIRLGNEQRIKPFLVGLPYRHNVLFDLAEGRLAGWWSGDTARQRTQGKTWYWEAPWFNVHLAEPVPEFVLLQEGRRYQPERVGQFVTEADAWESTDCGVVLEHRLHFRTTGSDQLTTIQLQQSFVGDEGKWIRKLEARGLEAGDRLAIRHRGLGPAAADGLHHFQRSPTGAATLELDYAVEEDPLGPPHEEDMTLATRRELPVMPGFGVTQLPLATAIMPTALAWSQDDELLIASLKGRVWRATDRDADQLEDTLQSISDDLAAPYGLSAANNYVDVVNKYGVVRLLDDDGDGRTDRHQLVASGWGHTADYHDWAVGLPRDAAGNYFVAIPCQQDERSLPAAHLRGKLLQLSPRPPSSDDPRLFDVKSLTAGHRFPMGIARNQEGQMFVTDNQGNYNPFNELNHIVPGAHYGFINRVEQQPGVAPPLTPPAIDIPHPWTRSVNGIFFLETPEGIEPPHFGPFEGHLVGCEYDTRRLIRMSVEEVDGWVQGAAYPLAVAAADPEHSLQGPINGGVAPDGDIYIANIRDSGWGGANNTGSIVRIVPHWEELPAGIAEVTIRPFGFHIRFTRPVRASTIGVADHYEISSYRRVSTPAYGGDDVDRRAESIVAVRPAADHQSVDVVLDDLRLGFVYEFRLQDLVEKPASFFPSEAFYTLRRLPK